MEPGARYECIYKNLLRDIRQFFSQLYDEFVSKKLNPVFLQQKNFDIKYTLFPYMIREFAKQVIDKELFAFFGS